jgi:DNA-binding transcriptional MocR family regulator
MSLSRRQSFVRIARDFDALIISDDVYDCLQWDTAVTGTPLDKAIMPRLVDIDQELDGGTSRFGADTFGNTVSNGSFSKLLGPGCRTGWVEGTELFVETFAQVWVKFSIYKGWSSTTQIPRRSDNC